MITCFLIVGMFAFGIFVGFSCNHLLENDAKRFVKWAQDKFRDKIHIVKYGDLYYVEWVSLTMFGPHYRWLGTWNYLERWKESREGCGYESLEGAEKLLENLQALRARRAKEAIRTVIREDVA